MKTPTQYRQMEFRSLMLEMAHLLDPKVYVEIGIKKAYTFNAMAQKIPECYGVDVNPQCQKYINYAEAKTHPVFVVGTSATFAREFCNKDKAEFIDFLFIDGYHHYESVLKDFYRLIPYVKTHTGIVFLHDTYPIKEELLQKGYCWDAWKAAKEIRESFQEYEVFTIPGPWAGLSMIRKLGETSADACHGWMDIEEGNK